MAKKPDNTKKYAVVGLEMAEYMPMEFNGRTYDLANLSKEDLAYLKKFPEQFPYLSEPTI